jgi:hypothetical protein
VLPDQKQSLHLCYGSYNPITSIASGSLVSFTPVQTWAGR